MRIGGFLFSDRLRHRPRRTGARALEDRGFDSLFVARAHAHSGQPAHAVSPGGGELPKRFRIPTIRSWDWLSRRQ